MPNRIYDLIENANKGTNKKTFLDNRKVNMVDLCSGKVVQNIEPPICPSVTSSHSVSRIKLFVNHHGSPVSTMMLSKILEDASCCPREQSVLCSQCLAHHPLHTHFFLLVCCPVINVVLKIFFTPALVNFP